MASYAEINNSLTLSAEEIARLLKEKEDDFVTIRDSARFDVGEGDGGDRTLVFSRKGQLDSLARLCYEVVPPIEIEFTTR